MRLFWAFILGLIAAFMSNVTANTFERWLNKQSKYKNLSVGWKLLIAAGTFSVISVGVYLLQPVSASRTFDFQVRVQDKKYRDITNAQVTLDVGER